MNKLFGFIFGAVIGTAVLAALLAGVIKVFLRFSNESVASKEVLVGMLMYWVGPAAVILFGVIGGGLIGLFWASRKPPEQN